MAKLIIPAKTIQRPTGIVSPRVSKELFEKLRLGEVVPEKYPYAGYVYPAGAPERYWVVEISCYFDSVLSTNLHNFPENEQRIWSVLPSAVLFVESRYLEALVLELSQVGVDYQVRSDLTDSNVVFEHPNAAAAA
jgi:hypothetical protein